ncbi:hypothetical protein [Bacteroides fluxus]|uniref:hypothetical protein n=1 Tax=Bacteroides fluxus TaxID=626930 RepID=UPI0023A848F7|nr:hypothetical protein [Bacteroides fluxus]
MTAIGGYFELELRQGEHYHKNAILLNSARSCFEYILLARGYKKMYIPFYTCEVLLQPLRKYGISYEFYSINKLFEPIGFVKLSPGEAFLYTNYFGLKQDCVERLAAIYGTQLIVDNAQAFFAPQINSIDTFYSPRKFFGVPDGGYLYTDCILHDGFQIDKSFDRMKHLIYRIDEGVEEGYTSFKQADNSLNNQPIRKMSKLTEALLQNIDYEYSKSRRRDNFITLHERLEKKNCIFCKLGANDVPMIYPYYSKNSHLKEILIKKRIFVATYWPNVLEWCIDNAWERQLVECLVPIPIDQRYGKIEMDKIVEQIDC